jgi:signal transduction histidine kinase
MGFYGNSSMTLRRKTLYLVSLTLAGLIVLVYLASHGILLHGFEELEAQAVQKDVARVVAVLDRELVSLRATGIDWAYWDDTYAFVQDEAPDYIDINLDLPTQLNLRLNLMAFVDADGELVYARALDLDSGESQPVPEELADWIAPGGLFANLADETDGRYGLTLAGSTPIQIVALPVLDSLRNGPPAGVLIFARYLDAPALAALSSAVNLDLALIPLDAADRPAASSVGVPAQVTPLNDGTVQGMTLLPDLSGQPSLTLEIREPRAIYEQGRASFIYFVTVLVLGGFVFLGVMLFIVERQVLSRLTRLIRAVDTIQATGDLSVPVLVPGQDELARLSGGMQAMLDDLNDYRVQLQAANEDLEQRVQARTEELAEKNTRLRHEISEHRHTQEKLAQARDQALEALRLKTQILANISHDARTPLNIITLRTEMLKKEYYGPLNARQHELLDAVMVNAKQLLGFVENLLQEAQYQAGVARLQSVRFSLAEQVEELTNTLQPLADRKGVAFCIEISPELAQPLYGDPERIQQILFNLVGNAIKFTQQGTVTLRATRPDPAHWALEVADTGPGIPPEVQERIFEPFWQVDGSLTREQRRGVGLGLSIVRQCTQLMQGEVTLVSEVGCGSQFTVTLPLQAAETE